LCHFIIFDHLSLKNFVFIFSVKEEFSWISLGGERSFLLDGDLENLTHDLSELEELLCLVELDSFSGLLHDAVVVNKKVILNNIEVLRWVNSDVHAFVHLLEVEVFGDNRFASWESLAELSNTGDGGHDSTDGIGWVLFLDGLDELSKGIIEHEYSLILLVDAHKESLKVELSTEGREDTLHNFSILHLVVLSSGNWKLLLT
jgi:hypothetical protein